MPTRHSLPYRSSYNKERANRAVEFIQNLKHTKGIWAGKPFILEKWQRDRIIRPIFGHIGKDGYREIRTAYVEIPRKNGKSEMAAAIALNLLCSDGEMGAEIYSAAADREQASLVFNVAADMVGQSAALRQRCLIRHSTKRIIYQPTGGFYKALSAEAFTKYGLNASGIIFDELHAQPNRELWDVLTTSTGARMQPLIFAITTAGYDRNSLCWEQHEYADRLLREIITDTTFWPVIYSVKEDKNWTHKKTWHRANPALGVFRSEGEMEAMCKKAQELPALENTFKRLYLNIWTRQEERFIPMHKWDRCDTKFNVEDLEGRMCSAGLDLASVNDVAALSLVFPPEEEEEPWKIIPYFWIPEENIERKIKVDRVPYDVWIRQGYVEATAGDVIDYKHIKKRLDLLSEIYDIVDVAYDRWGATKLVQDLEDEGFTVVQFGQGFASMSGPTKELLKLILGGQLAHNGNPVLRWMADNMVVKQDPAGNFKPDKGKSTEKIDGIVATIMGLDRAIRNQDKVGAYRTRGVLTI